jgi:hypothetical protein
VALPTPPFDRPLLGAHTHALWDHYDDDVRARVLDQLVAAGVRSIRLDIGWSTLEEECRGCLADWYVDRLDRTVEQASARGLDILGVFWRTPPWAGPGDPADPPDDPEEYARMARWAAERYAGRITAWELWNEPDLEEYFTGTTADYVELVEAAAPAIREGSPTAKVVLAGPSDSDDVWLADVLDRGVGPLVDVIGVHQYTTPSDDPPTLPDPDGRRDRFAHLDTIVELVEQRAPGTPVWLTEFGWSTHETAADARPWQRGVTAEAQASNAVDALVLLRDRWPSIERAYWYRALDRDSDRLHLDNFGLLRTDTTPKPVLDEIRSLLWDPPPVPPIGPGLPPPYR